MRFYMPFANMCIVCVACAHDSIRLPNACIIHLALMCHVATSRAPNILSLKLRTCAMADQSVGMVTAAAGIVGAGVGGIAGGLGLAAAGPAGVCLGVAGGAIGGYGAGKEVGHDLRVAANIKYDHELKGENKGKAVKK